MDLRSVNETGLTSSLRLQQTPSSPAKHILDAPAEMVAIGFADGVIGLWSRSSGQKVVSARLHGPIQDMAISGDYLLALSALGDVLKWDLKALKSPACEVLKDIWSSVPVVWSHGQPETVPPPTNHVCLDAARSQKAAN